MASLAAISHLRLLFLLLVPYLASSQSNITPGQSLVAGDKGPAPWLSPSGDFALGFSQLENSDSFLVSIWYDKIPEKTIVWYASNENQPIIAPRGSKLVVAADRGLTLNDPRGGSLWSSRSIIGAVAYGYMNDTGNFVLKNSNSEILWESFEYPTDTILPEQIISNNEILLSSRQSASNFSLGRFRLHLQDGDLQLRTINLPSSYANEPYFTFTALPPSTPVTGISFNDSGFLNLLYNNGQMSLLTTGSVVSARDYYLRATLESDGVFIQYSYPKTGGSWERIWFKPDNICKSEMVNKGSGICGYNRICTLNETHRPFCECPRGFSLLDPKDEYRGCVPDYSQGCEQAESSRLDLFVMDEVTDIDWPTSDYELLEPFQEGECKESCLHDCMCAVAIFRDSDKCWKKKLPLSNGRIIPELNAKAFIKRRKDGVPPQTLSPPGPDNDKKDTLILAGSVLLGSSVFFNFVLIGATGLGFFLIYQNKLKKFFRDESGMDINIHSFTYKELENATDGFKEELGRGSFGIVYKGVIEIGDSKNVVAIKKLDRFFQESEREFKTEVLVIGQTHHKNLVKLIGYCNEGQNRLLVYEFLSNGTLASFLFEDLKPSWEQRTQIALGIGRGLLYLHEECSTQIIHCDIKPQNILLDEYYNARISDFGLAKLLINQAHTHTAIRGTRGYVAPEWFRNMPITVKVDVYSFGILLLEIICCRRSIDIEVGTEEGVILADWAYDCYREGMVEALVGKDEGAMNDMKKLERFVMVAIWCIQEDPALRPSMKKVMLMLEGIIQRVAIACSEEVAIFRDGSCWKKRIPLSNGKMDLSVGGKALIKVRINNSTSEFPGDVQKKHKNSTLIIIGSALLSSSVCVNLLLLLATYLLCRSVRYGNSKWIRPFQINQAKGMQTFTYQELKEATDGFKKGLGRGAFGAVYKGVLGSNDTNFVAVKVLEKKTVESEKEFEREVSAIGQTNHKNLVQLLGFCNEGQHRMLVYEFMSNGTLADFLFGASRPSWYKRIEVACGVARGLAYLHDDCTKQIIHCDIKPQNILLDDSLSPKISDFGLAKLLMADQTGTTTGVRGTRGYLAPEWFRNMPISGKVDVYSFGIVLLELICCRKHYELEVENEDQRILVDWVYDCYSEGNLHLLVESDEEALSDKRRVERFVMTAMWCIQAEPGLRPSMKKITQMLEGAVVVSVPPNPDSFISSI